MLFKYFSKFRRRITRDRRSSHERARHCPKCSSFERLEDRLVLSATPYDAGAPGLTSLAKINNELGFLATGAQIQASSSGTGSAQDGMIVDDALWQWNNNAIGINALATIDGDTLAADLIELGMQSVEVSGQMVSGFLPTTAISALTTLDSLRFAEPALKSIPLVGSVTSDGDKAMRSTVARNFAGLTGEGIKVGVISDSYDNGGDGSAATDIASGDLPGIGNTTPVTVLSDNVSATDEGRAMLQIVHDIAPKASLLFSNIASFSGVENTQFYADSIRNLQANGANIIVDDILHPTEPFFMDGLINQAIDEVVSKGTTYISAVGNQARDSYESSFRPDGTETFTFNGNSYTELLHDFDPGPGVDTRQRIHLPSGPNTIMFQWDDPFVFEAPNSGGAVRDFDIFLFQTDTNHTLFRAGVGSTIGGNARDNITISNLLLASDFDLVIGLRNGTNPGGFLKYVLINRDDTTTTINEFDTGSPTAVHHANALGAIGVGAAYYKSTPEFGQTPAIRESFSSVGGASILFDVNGVRLPQPVIRNAVDVVGPDGGNTSFFGSADPTGTGQFEADGFRNFFGTSAAAPHVAGLAALLLQADPLLSPADVLKVLQTTAFDMGTSGIDTESGAGLVDALGALGAVRGIEQLKHLTPDAYTLIATSATADSLNPGSLRTAIINANTPSSTQKKILLPAGTFQLSISGTEGDSQGDFEIAAAVTIIGAGAGATVIDATPLQSLTRDRIFDVLAGATLDLSSVTLTGGAPNAATGSSGGAIRVAASGTLLVDKSAIVSNSTIDDGGGGVALMAGSTATITNSVIAGNSASNVGGGLYLEAGTGSVTVTNTIIANNSGLPLTGDVFAGRTIKSGGNNRLTTSVTGFGAVGDYVAAGVTPLVVTDSKDSYGNSVTYIRSLRELIGNANGTVGSQEIWVPAWHLQMTRTGANDVDQGDFDITHLAADGANTSTVTIRGVGAGETIIDASPLRLIESDRVFDIKSDVNAEAKLVLLDMTVTGGRAPSSAGEMEGGGVFVRGTGSLEIDRVAIVGNETTMTMGWGGGIYFSEDSHGKVDHSVIAANKSSSGYGAGIYLMYTTNPAPDMTDVTVSTTMIANNTSMNDWPDAHAQPQANNQFKSAGNNRITSIANGFSSNENDYWVVTPGSNPIVVTGLNDSNDGTNDNVVRSLRESIIQANSTTGAQEIWVPAWQLRMTQSGTGGADQGDFDITESTVTIRGVAAGETIIDAGPLRVTANSDRVFDVKSGATLNLYDATVTGGRAPDAAAEYHGGGIYVRNGERSLWIVRLSLATKPWPPRRSSEMAADCTLSRALVAALIIV